MAEGGESESGMSSDMIATTVNARSLECPICLDKLRRPKSLPCLHSFCEECLAAYITKETEDKSINAFPCPICRTATSPVDPTATADVWAGQFPTNSLIMELSDTITEHFCQPCTNKGNSKSPAEFWCNEMNTFFCSDCKTSLHDMIHVKCDIMTVSNMKESSDTKYPRCQKHKKKTGLYCEDHNTLACSNCIAIDHRKCDIVLTAADYCDKLNGGSKFGELKTCVSEGINKLQTWIKDTKKHVETFTTDRDQILSDLADLRQKVIAKFDEIQGDLIKDLTEVYNEQKTKAEKLSQKCESMKMAMTTTQQLAETTSLSADPTHTITVYLRGNAEVESCGSLLQDVETSYKPISIRYESTDVKDFKFDIGKIAVEQVSLDSIQQSNMKPFSERSAQKIAKVNVRSPSDRSLCDVTGILLIPDGHIVLTDNNNKKIKLLTDNGDLLDELCLPDEPSGLCQVTDTTVAVTRPEVKTISLVDITSSKLSMRSDASITTGKPCYGIIHHDGIYTVTTGRKKPSQVYSVTQSGHTETLYRPQRSPLCLVYDPTERDIVVTLNTSSPGDVAVCRLSTGGSYKAIAHRDIIKGPRGVALDSDGNIYICRYSSKNIVQMSCDGSMVRELLTPSDGLPNPNSISVRADKLVLACSCNDHITSYQLV